MIIKKNPKQHEKVKMSNELKPDDIAKIGAGGDGGGQTKPPTVAAIFAPIILFREDENDFFIP